LIAALLAGWPAAGEAQILQLPTANRALFTPGAEEKFFVGTIGRPWTSGTFGCVRSEGRQLHEGIDIRCLQRDRHGEPTDPVMATADGTVVYFNKKSALSEFGNYLIVRHVIEGLDIYSTYAHLREIRADLKIGSRVRAGEVIATLGRTANTREGISKERAHLHFELGVLLNDRFPEWYRRTFPGNRNDHGAWNGQNLLGLDPRLILLEQQRHGSNFSLLQFVRAQTELCRVFVRDTDFPWLRRYAPLVIRNPVAEQQGVAGYEMALNYVGLPFQLIPRAASEIRGSARIQLLSVNAAEQQRHPCRKLVTPRGSRWELATAGLNLVNLLAY
jgi:murein DD-endopeptidase MepM/ murein hydrolase activator NlpD